MRKLAAVLTVAATVVAASFYTEASACLPPPGGNSVIDEIPEQIPVQGALPVVFAGSSESQWAPLEDPMVTFEVRNSNDKLIPGDAETYTIWSDGGQYWTSFHILVAWRPTDGWAFDETYTLTLKTDRERVQPQEIEHNFTTVDATGDVAAPGVDEVRLSVSEERGASDCCVPDPDVYDTCTNMPVSSCWTTEFEYTPYMRLDLGAVADDIWASQTLFTLANDSNRPLPRPSIDSTTRFTREVTFSDNDYCLTPVAVRIADGRRVEGDEICRGPSDLPDYEERNASEHVGVPEECQDQVDTDAGGGSDAGPDAGTDSDAGDNPDAGTGADAGDSDASTGEDADSQDGGSGQTDGSSQTGGRESGCGCASSNERPPVGVVFLVLLAGGFLWWRRRPGGLWFASKKGR